MRSLYKWDKDFWKIFGEIDRSLAKIDSFKRTGFLLKLLYVSNGLF